MLEGPIGAAAFNNEFGRPNLAGYFRTFEELVAGEMRGYHKPIMLAGGMGHVAARPCVQGGFPAWRAADSTGRAGHVDWSRRWRGFQHGYRGRMRRTSISIQCSAATLKWNGARRKSSTAAGKWNDAAKPIQFCPSTTSARAVCRTRCLNCCMARTGGVIQFARHSLRRAGDVAHADLEQRGAGALRACNPAGVTGIVPCDLRARTLPVCGGRHGMARRTTDRG